MNPTHRYMQLRCPQCFAVSLCGTEDMLSRLRRLGILRREKEPDVALVLELFRSAAGRFECPECGRTGLSAVPADGDDDEEQWTGQRRCKSCDTAIPKERVDLLPDVRLCAECQRRDETGASDEREFCPRCGSVMRLVLQGGAGISRYQMKCPECRG